MRWDTLPLGMEKRFLTNLQVGSIENPGSVDYPVMSGWPIEEVLKLSPDETKAVLAMRQEFDAERRKLEAEIAEFYRTEAEKLRELRLKYEQKVNEALSPESRETKQKFDALREELIAKKKALVTDTLGADVAAFKGSQMSTAVGKLREALPKIIAEIETKFLEIVPAEAKAKIEATLKQQAAMRERMYQMHGPSSRPMPPQPPMAGQNVKPPQPAQPPNLPPPTPPAQPAAQPAVEPPRPPPEEKK